MRQWMGKHGRRIRWMMGNVCEGRTMFFPRGLMKIKKCLCRKNSFLWHFYGAEFLPRKHAPGSMCWFWDFGIGTLYQYYFHKVPFINKIKYHSPYLLL
jgi:hypothetical protein